ncbi:hypothetical protein D3C80_867570 [compost metagenome]
MVAADGGFPEDRQRLLARSSCRAQPVVRRPASQRHPAGGGEPACKFAGYGTGHRRRVDGLHSCGSRSYRRRCRPAPRHCRASGARPCHAGGAMAGDRRRPYRSFEPHAFAIRALYAAAEARYPARRRGSDRRHRQRSRKTRSRVFCRTRTGQIHQRLEPLARRQGTRLFQRGFRNGHVD